MNLPIKQFCSLKNGKHFPTPNSIIQVAVSDYRRSDISDREFAENICKSLSIIMEDYNLKLASFPGLDLTFEEKQDK